VAALEAQNFGSAAHIALIFFELPQDVLALAPAIARPSSKAPTGSVPASNPKNQSVGQRKPRGGWRK